MNESSSKAKDLAHDIISEAFSRPYLGQERLERFAAELIDAAMAKLKGELNTANLILVANRQLAHQLQGELNRENRR